MANSIHQHPTPITYYPLQGIVFECVEHGGEIALTSVGQQHHNLLSLVFLALGNLGSGKECGSGRDAYQQSLLLGNLTACADGIVVLHVEHLVDDAGIVGVGHETGTDALNLMRAALSAVQHW